MATKPVKALRFLLEGRLRLLWNSEPIRERGRISRRVSQKILFLARKWIEISVMN
jgi:hypothetical protein